MCPQDLTKDICVGCVFSVKSCIKIHYFWLRSKGNLKVESFSLYFLIVHNVSLNSDHLYASLLKLTLLLYYLFLLVFSIYKVLTTKTLHLASCCKRLFLTLRDINSLLFLTVTMSHIQSPRRSVIQQVSSVRN